MTDNYLTQQSGQAMLEESKLDEENAVVLP